MRKTLALTLALLCVPALALAFDVNKAATCAAYAAMAAKSDSARLARAVAILTEAAQRGALAIVQEKARAILAQRDTSLGAVMAGQRACDSF